MKVGIVAGEASGDLLGSLLIEALKEKYPHIEWIGIAGPRMQAAGAQSLYPMEKLAVRGYVEVLKRFRGILQIRNGLKNYFLQHRPHLFIGIDAPDFNLGLEKTLKQAGIPTIHYVSPSIWAWRGERIHKIAQAVNLMLTVFPFEAALYEKQGIPVVYVGHPLADAIPQKPQREAARQQLKLQADDLYVALLPGSRQTELDYHAALFVETAKAFLKVFPQARFLVPLATRETRDQFEAARWQLQAQDLPLQILFGHANLALAAADVALVASGTATLEAALWKCPHVIAYRMSPTTLALMKRKAYLPYAGLPNILSGEFIVPEFIQEEATPANLVQAMGNLISHKVVRERLSARFADLHASLSIDNATRIGNALAPYLDNVSMAATPA